MDPEGLGKGDNAGIHPVALGLISDPPTIVLTYDSKSSASANNRRQRRKRKMPLRDFTDKSNVKRYAFNLRQRHNKYLSDVIDVTLEKMLRIIQEIQKGNSVGKSLEIVNKEYFIDPKEDLNTLSPAQLAQRKAVMEETFRKNLVKPGDPDYVYDKVIQFDGESASNEVNNDWDDDEDRTKQNDSSPKVSDNFEKEDMLDQRNFETPQDDQVNNFTSSADNAAEMQVDPSSPNIDEGNRKFDTLPEVKAEVAIQQDEEGIMQVQKTEPESDESSTNDIEEALEIETGALDEEDEEDFW
ncbi:unnamed protein product [Orchesella dallaii]|uniref:Centrosomal protein of 19 kDa n=1 Tax=Orchesella dallaii TaxID=48710 RepID=A0ABP1QX41_9HEXA